MYISKSSNLFFWNLIKIRLKIIYCYMQYRCNEFLHQPFLFLYGYEMWRKLYKFKSLFRLILLGNFIIYKLI